jgi:hypothetical protein
VRLAERLGELYPGWPHERRTGAATVALALLDGLMLHYLLDGELPIGEALAALDALIAGASGRASAAAITSTKGG